MNVRYAPFIQAILYGDIFDFPLTRDELWQYAISKDRLREESLAAFIKHLPRQIKCTGIYFHLAGREDIVQKRVQRIQASKKKLIIAKKAAAFLSGIPTIRLVGISGGVSVLNANEEDDIDLFIITAHNSVWTTRFLALLFLELQGIRRKRTGTVVQNRICVNMYLDEDNLAFSNNRRDIYTAHEIVQVVPFVDKNNTYERFVRVNAWISGFLPNALKHGITQSYRENRFSLVLRKVLQSSVLENPAKQLQILYMRPHRTRETVSDTILAFHPVDYRGDTLKTYKERIRQYEKI